VVTSSVAAEGAIARAKALLAKVRSADAAALAERRCSAIALNPAAFTRYRGSECGASEVSEVTAEAEENADSGRASLAEVGFAS
jgi:hypothetical protein